MTAAKKTVLISGASGFLGQALCNHFNAEGYIVRALVRDVEKSDYLVGHSKGGIFKCDLPNNIDEAAFNGKIDAIIHCAYASQAHDQAIAEKINIQGSKRLLKLARENDISPFVFISSLSAHEDARSFYGKSKLRIEEGLDPLHDLIIRPGLIVGNGGLYLRMKTSASKLPIIPLFYGGKQAIQFIHIDDLCNGVENAISKQLTGKFNVAITKAIPIKEFYQQLKASKGKQCHFIYLPGTLSLLVLRFLEFLGLNLPITSENLLGLKHMKTFNTGTDLVRLGIDAGLTEHHLRVKEE